MYVDWLDGLWWCIESRLELDWGVVWVVFDEYEKLVVWLEGN